MKIAFLLRLFPTTSETFILSQISEVLLRGHQVEIISIYSNDKIKHKIYNKYRLKDIQIPPTAVPFHPFSRILKALFLFLLHPHLWFKLIPTLNFLKYKRQARSLYLFYLCLVLFNKAKKYDVIHCHFGLMGLIGCDLKDLGLIDGKIVTSFHGMDVSTYPSLHGPNIYRRLFQEGDMFTANSSFTVSKLKKLGCPAERIRKLPVGVDLDKFTYVKHNRKIQDPIIILSVGRLVDVKGFQYGIEAIAQISNLSHNIHYIIIGDGPLRKQLQQLADQLGIVKNIRFMGEQSQEFVRDAYQNAHIFLLPSITKSDGSAEAQGLVLQEAQASGLPVISTSVGGISDGLVDGASGFLVPEKNSKAIAEKLCNLIEDPQMCDAMGIKGRQFVEENYSLDTLTDRLERIYKDVLSCQD
jgi:colanic acid/amylovoran biosynthesis glycosyltransferase